MFSLRSFLWNITTFAVACIPRNAHEVDTIAILAMGIGYIMPQMGAVATNAFAIRQAPYVFPIHVLIAKTRPSVTFAFVDKIVPMNVSTRRGARNPKQGKARVAVVENEGLLIGSTLLRIFVSQKGCTLMKISMFLGKVSIVIANTIRQSAIHLPFQIGLYRNCRSAMLFALHEGISANQGQGWLGLLKIAQGRKLIFLIIILKIDILISPRLLSWVVSSTKESREHRNSVVVGMYVCSYRRSLCDKWRFVSCEINFFLSPIGELEEFEEFE